MDIAKRQLDSDERLYRRLSKLLDRRNNLIDKAVDTIVNAPIGKRHRHLVDALPQRYFGMKDWILKKLSDEWTVFYLKNCTDTYLFDHKCGGAVSYFDEEKVCSQCKTPVPGKFIMVVQMIIKRELLRV